MFRCVSDKRVAERRGLSERGTKKVQRQTSGLLARLIQSAAVEVVEPYDNHQSLALRCCFLTVDRVNRTESFVDVILDHIPATYYQNPTHIRMHEIDRRSFTHMVRHG